MNSQAQWQFVGSVPENYERYLVPSSFGSWAEDLVEMAALRPGERVLDIACGTGIVARIAARKLAGSGSVVGLDLSAPMLEAARAAAAAEGMSNRAKPGLCGSSRSLDAAYWSRRRRAHDYRSVQLKRCGGLAGDCR